MKKLPRLGPSGALEAPAQMEFPVLKPTGQINFYSRLQAVKKRYLHEALKETIAAATFDLRALDEELASFVEPAHLKQLASFHLRGEAFFAVPYLLVHNPFLLGYYRLLYGFSCKAFYEQGPFKRFQRLENDGLVESRIEPQIPSLCRTLCATGSLLVELIEDVSLATVNELQILTLGAQFRGSGNVKVGQNATDSFFSFLKDLLSPYNPQVKGRQLTFLTRNSLSWSALAPIPT
jgi:hypothetical protein